MALPSSRSSQNEHVFHTYPQKFPKTRRKAVEMLNQIHLLTKKGPRTLVGTVVDVSFHASQGYVTVTTELGVLSVYGVPYGTLVPQMRILCRQMGGHASNRAFVFDGFAPNLSQLGQSSGSLVVTTPPALALTSGLAHTSSTAVPSTSRAGSTGYIWQFFFYIPVLPASKVTLWQMIAASGGTTLILEYLPNGYLRLLSGDGHGYITTAPIAPHSMHYVQVQPANSGMQFLVDTQATFTGITTGSDEITFAGSSTNYQLSLLSSSDGSQLCPIGSWISKWGMGLSYSSGIILLPNTVPGSDATLPTTTSTTNCYTLLCGDSIGSSTLLGTSTFSSPPGTTVNTAAGSVLATGPY